MLSFLSSFGQSSRVQFVERHSSFVKQNQVIFLVCPSINLHTLLEMRVDKPCSSSSEHDKMFNESHNFYSTKSSLFLTKLSSSIMISSLPDDTTSLPAGSPWAEVTSRVGSSSPCVTMCLEALLSTIVHWFFILFNPRRANAAFNAKSIPILVADFHGGSNFGFFILDVYNYEEDVQAIHNCINKSRIFCLFSILKR